MTGPEHYTEAERLIQDLPAKARAGDFTHEDIAMIQRTAQVHATLALAAAIAFSGDMTAGEWPGWRDAAASEQTKAP